jgi:hypothetical protein
LKIYSLIFLSDFPPFFIFDTLFCHIFKCMVFSAIVSKSAVMPYNVINFSFQLLPLTLEVIFISFINLPVLLLSCSYFL